MDKQLEAMWRVFNRNLFANELKPLINICFQEIADRGGIGAYGKFFPKPRCIAIDMNFRFDAEGLKRGNPNEQLKFSVASAVLTRLMVHQALHQREEANPGGDGETFLAEAQRISKLMDIELPTPENVERWPPF